MVGVEDANVEAREEESAQSWEESRELQASIHVIKLTRDLGRTYSLKLQTGQLRKTGMKRIGNGKAIRWQVPYSFTNVVTGYRKSQTHYLSNRHSCTIEKGSSWVSVGTPTSQVKVLIGIIIDQGSATWGKTPQNSLSARQKIKSESFL